MHGISLLLVLFLLIILSLLSAALVQLNRGSASAVGIEIQSTRALFAAESGAQLAAMQIFPINGTAPACPAVLPFTQTFTVSALANCQALITCNSVIANGRTLFNVTSEGSCGAGADFARRKITIGLRSL